MKTFSSSVSISASAEKIWSLLTDAGRYTEWNPTVERIDGEIRPGKTITVHARIASGRAFPVKVAEFSPPHRMVWSGGMPFGLFKGERTFALEQASAGLVRFSMQETFSGLLSPLIEKSIPNLQPAFDEFASSLKARAEER
jgi:hypothetical protein